MPTIRTLLLGLACPRIRSPNTLYRALKYVSIDYNYVYVAAGTVCQVFWSVSSDTTGEFLVPRERQGSPFTSPPFD